MVLENLNRYKLSILLFLIISFSLFTIYGLEIFSLTFNFLLRVNYLLYIISGLVGFIAASSFFFPYYSYIHYRKKKISKKYIFFSIMNFVYFDVIGYDSDDYLAKKLKIKNKQHMFFIVRMADTLSLVIIIVISLFFVKNASTLYFFYIVLILESMYVFSKLFKHRKEVKKEGLKKFSVYIISCIFRYFLEFPRTLITFYAVGVFLDVPIVFIFLASSSFLYFLPKFKSAGGLLELYVPIFFLFLGRSMLEGFIVAGLFRVSGIIFHILPMYLYKKLTVS